MLQCFDPESRLIYVLGTMFHLDSKIGAEILEISPEAYRQRLSRIRQSMTAFLGKYCGLSGSGKCGCEKRVGYAIRSHRLNPEQLEYSQLDQSGDVDMDRFVEAMESMDERSMIFAQLPKYRSPQVVRDFLRDILISQDMQMILNLRA